MLLIAILTQCVMVLAFLRVLPGVRRRALDSELSPTIGRMLQWTWRLRWFLLVAPALSLVLVVFCPSMPQTPFTPATILAWALLLLNIVPTLAGHMLLPLVKTLSRRSQIGQTRA